MSSPRVITYKQFLERYRPLSSGIVEGDPDRAMFETFGRDFATVRHADPAYVWTVLDVEITEDDRWFYDDEAGDNCWVIAAGYHYVNRIAYVITEIPWASPDIEVVY